MNSTKRELIRRLHASMARRLHVNSHREALMDRIRGANGDRRFWLMTGRN